ncbi:hypothetical protein GCM10023192_49590 [Amycolatopsis samaneae]
MCPSFGAMPVRIPSFRVEDESPLGYGKGIVTVGKRQDKTTEDREKPPHKPQGTGKQGPPDPDKPPGRHTK